MKKFLLLSAVLLFTAFGGAAVLLFAPKNTAHGYKLKIEKGEGIAAVGRQLEDENVVYSRHILLAGAYILGLNHKITGGTYRLPAKVSAWQILKRLQAGSPDSVTVRLIEGIRLKQMRRILNETPDLIHKTIAMSDTELLKAVDPKAEGPAEGWFAPDSYDVDSGADDLQIFKAAYRAQKKRLEDAWNDRQTNLPYKNPYELLIMASLIEKETAHKDDRGHVAAVFVNRLRIGMRLQTDPTVIYGMGDAYSGRIRKDDLRRDTPYNTYTRNGLPPTPISLPGRAALEAAAHPNDSDYLYFVSKMDSSGRSQFSTTLQEHNAAVRKYILKR